MNKNIKKKKKTLQMIQRNTSNFLSWDNQSSLHNISQSYNIKSSRSLRPTWNPQR